MAERAESTGTDGRASAEGSARAAQRGAAGHAVLGRKLRRRPEGASRAGSEAEPAEEWARLLPRAFTRAVSAGAGLSAEPGRIAERRVPLAELLERIAEDGLVLLLSRDTADPGEAAAADPMPFAGDEAAPSGIMVFDGKLFTALVEALTLGRLASRPAQPRRATVTDAALLTELAGRLLAEGDAHWPLAGWHVERAVPDLRLLPALLPEAGFALSELPLTLVDGEIRRAGTLAIALPSTPKRPLAGPAGRESLRGEVAEPEAAFGAALQNAALGASARLETVLGRLSIPLSDALRLRPGMLLELPLARLEGIEIVGLDGRVCGEGRLGQAQGLRAIRLTSLAADLT